MPNLKSAKSKLFFCIATGCYSGLSSKAPGTAGSIAVIPFWILLHSIGLWDSILLRITVVIVVIALGILSSRHVMQEVPDNHDPQFIVVDEWAGMLIAFLGIPEPSVLSILLVLAWFRFFDILKPGPVSWAERLPGPYGVMADDCVAGLLACIAVWACQMGLGNI